MVLPSPLYLNNVLVTPGIIKNLLSVHQFTTNNWCSMEFDPLGLFVKDLATRNVIIGCNSLGPLYTIHLLATRAPQVSTYYALTTTPVVPTSLWHYCLGHPSADASSKVSTTSVIICNKS
jgi:hypothetical protein